MARWQDSPADQLLTLARILATHVPVMLMGATEGRLRRRFSTVAADIDEQYESVPFAFDGNVSWRVFVHRPYTPSGTAIRLGLPC